MAYDMICITGPTASGKTSVAAALAARLSGEVISADSRQVYRGMDIGTGKDLGEYRLDDKQIPTHLIDILEAGEQYSVFDFQQDFYKSYTEIKQGQRLPILCGGTGLYIESVIDRYRLMPVPENPVLRAQLTGKSDDELTAKLAGMVPLHNTTDTNSREKLIRAIEIADYQEKHRNQAPGKPDINTLLVGIRPGREERRERITHRLRERLGQGMVEEAKSLMDNGVPAEKLIAYGLEYKYLAQYLTGELSYAQMFSGLNTAIHRFAKRQMTWFRRMERKGMKIRWIDAQVPLPEKLCLIENWYAEGMEEK